MPEPKIPLKEPISVDVKKGESYWWCSCGYSNNQPFCDGSHTPHGFLPMEYVAKRDRTLWFCACKKTKSPPFCDGTHNEL